MPIAGKRIERPGAGLLSAVFLILALDPGAGRAMEPGIARLADKGLTCLYNLEFNPAMAVFEELRRTYPGHPAGSALMATATWWQARYWFAKPDEAASASMELHLKEAIALARELADKPGSACEGGFFLGATLGIKAYWDMIQNKWVRAVLDSREAVEILKPVLSCTEFAAEASFGLGIYEYHAARLPWHLKWLSSFLVSDMTDKQNALVRFRFAAEHSRYMRNDAQGTLALIHALYDPDPPSAVRYASLLAAERPDSPMAHGLLIQALAVSGRWEEALRMADRLISRDAGFASESATYRYWKGIALLGLKRPEEARENFSMAIVSPGRLPWITASYFKRGCAYDLLGKRKEAKADYVTVLKRPDPWNEGRRARTYLSRRFTWDDFPREISPRGL